MHPLHRQQSAVSLPPQEPADPRSPASPMGSIPVPSNAARRQTLRPRRRVQGTESRRPAVPGDTRLHGLLTHRGVTRRTRNNADGEPGTGSRGPCASPPAFGGRCHSPGDTPWLSVPVSLPAKQGKALTGRHPGSPPGALKTAPRTCERGLTTGTDTVRRWPAAGYKSVADAECSRLLQSEWTRQSPRSGRLWKPDECEVPAGRPGQLPSSQRTTWPGPGGARSPGRPGPGPPEDVAGRRALVPSL